MTTRESTAPLVLLTTAERTALHDAMPTDQPLLAAAVQQGDLLLPFLTELADLLRAGQAEAALTRLDAALAPVAALDANADGLVTTLAALTTAWSTLVRLCPDGTLPVAVLTDPAALQAVVEAAEAVRDQGEELALRATDRARLLEQRRAT